MNAIAQNYSHRSVMGVSRWRPRLGWAGYGLLLGAAPWLFPSDASIAVLCQIATTIVFCLSYNMLLGQGGMLSFGHAVYSGLGAYFVIHAMNRAGGFPLPLPLLPIVGGFSGLLFGAVFGYVTTKRAGTAFAMITLGIAELVLAASHIFPRFFGGESGVTTNRSAGGAVFGLTFASQMQVYYLIACWVFACTLAMYAFTRTPLGRIANAVRDNPERAEFIGYSTHRVRYLTLLISTFFAGISGGLAAINFEIAGTEALSMARSADALFFTFIGGTAAFAGPILGAIVGVLLTAKLSDLSVAWQLYLGLIFVFMVVFAPSGLAGIAADNWRVLRSGSAARLLPAWLAAGVSALTMLAGAVLLTETLYGVTFGDEKVVLVQMLKARTGAPVLAGCTAGIALLAVGAQALRRARRWYCAVWNTVVDESVGGPN